MRLQIFEKGGASNDDLIRRYLKHFLCQDDADILELGPGFTINDYIKSLREENWIDYWDLWKHAQ